MYILDTDHLSLIQRNGQEGKRILARLSSIEDSTIAVTVITYEEQVRGRLTLSEFFQSEMSIFGYPIDQTQTFYKGTSNLMALEPCQQIAHALKVQKRFP